MMSTYHEPVMLPQCIEGLALKPEGTYVDATFGGGGHAKAIIDQLTEGVLYAFDQDIDAKANAKKLSDQLEQQRSFTFIESNFRYLRRYLKFHGVTQVDGILADLGVSSHQLDEGTRGFSTRFDGDLDMRMDRQAEKSAFHVVNQYAEADLVHIFSAYGEIRNARTLANAIIRERATPITRTAQLKTIATSVAPRGKEMKYLSQVYQAIRIEVNDEMGVLREFLQQTIDVVMPQGRLVIMSYHSLEDRLVKNFMNTGNFKGVMEKDFYGHEIRPFRPINKKPIVSETEEINVNKRARSAKLRIAERIEIKK